MTDFAVKNIAVESFCQKIGDTKHSLDDGTNALSLHGIAEAHRPRFTYLPRYQLLKSLSACSRSLGKETSTRANDVTSCSSFDILGSPGAFSGAHVDALTGTWLRNLTGIKLWMIVPQEEMIDAWKSFAEHGPLFEPKGRERLILLDIDDVLFMPPGVKVVHAVHTMETSLMEGGMVWDYCNVSPILESIYWIASYQMATNEAIPWELLAIVAALQRQVNSDIARFMGEEQRHSEFRAGIRRMVSKLKALGCKCSRAQYVLLHKKP